MSHRLRRFHWRRALIFWGIYGLFHLLYLAQSYRVDPQQFLMDQLYSICDPNTFRWNYLPIFFIGQTIFIPNLTLQEGLRLSYKRRVAFRCLGAFLTFACLEGSILLNRVLVLKVLWEEEKGLGTFWATWGLHGHILVLFTGLCILLEILCQRKVLAVAGVIGLGMFLPHMLLMPSLREGVFLLGVAPPLAAVKALAIYSLIYFLILFVGRRRTWRY